MSVPSIRPQPTPPLPAVAPQVLMPSGRPEFGCFRGVPDTVRYDGLARPYSRNRLQRFLRHKKWMYVFAATDDVVVVTAIVDAGPTGTAFVMVTDRATGEVIADASRPGAARPLVGVNDEPRAGHRSHYAMPGTLATFRGDGDELHVRVTLQSLIPIPRSPWLDLDLRLATNTHPGITAVSEIAQGSPMVTTTAKNAALLTSGQLTVRRDGQQEEYGLTGGWGGYDYTSGFLPRHTSWRWAFTTGTLSDGRPFGLNLVSRFSGIEDRALENVLWLDGVAYPLDPAARIQLDPADPMASWRVFTTDGSVDLTFEPLAVHRESLNLRVIRSSFLQPTGHFSGRITVADQELAIDALPGVVEDQDIVW